MITVEQAKAYMKKALETFPGVSSAIIAFTGAKDVFISVEAAMEAKEEKRRCEKFLDEWIVPMYQYRNFCYVPSGWYMDLLIAKRAGDGISVEYRGQTQVEQLI